MKTKILALALVFTMLMSSFAFAGVDYEELTDVKDMEWAEPFIKKVLDADVMPAYETKEFKPSQHATKMEVVNVIYRIALLKGDVTTAQADTYVSKYKSTIDGYLIPNQLAPYGADNHRAIAYALEREIIKKSELSLFFVKGTFEVISKVDASVYISKALNIYLKQNVNKFYEIQYKDGSEINLLQWPWINLLIEKEIVVGGNDKNFYPNSILNRNILAVLSSNILRELETYKPTNNTTTPVEQTQEITGKISIIHYDKNIIEIRDSNSNLFVFDSKGAKLTLNGSVIAIQNLEPGMNATMTVKGRTLVTLEVKENLTSVKGILGSVGFNVTVGDETFRAVSVKTDSGYKYYKALNSVIVERDYTSSDLDELREGDIIEVFYQGEYAKKVEALSTKAVLTGSLERSADFDKGDAISVKLSNGKLFEQTLTEVVSKYNMPTNGLSKGDIVKITIEKGKITAVEATGLSTEANGRITKIVISSNPQISIIDNKGTTRTFDVSQAVVVKNLGSIDDTGMYALRLDQEVTLDLNNMKVALVEINKSVEKTKFRAKITEIHKSINLIKAVDSDDKTWIVSLEGSDQNINDYKVGNEVFISGVEISGDLFEADLIIVVTE